MYLFDWLEESREEEVKEKIAVLMGFLGLFGSRNGWQEIDRRNYYQKTKMPFMEVGRVISQNISVRSNHLWYLQRGLE